MHLLGIEADRFLPSREEFVDVLLVVLAEGTVVEWAVFLVPGAFRKVEFDARWLWTADPIVRTTIGRGARRFVRRLVRVDFV